MLGSLSRIIRDASTLRRMMFATAFLPPKTPDFWGIIVEFATLGKTDRAAVTTEQARVLMENLKSLDAQAFSTDQQLLQELTRMPVPSRNEPLGLILISSREECILCGSKLLVRADKASRVVVYDDKLGTVPATHFHKYCSRRSCPCTQFYGFYTCSDSSTYYDADCTELDYFMSTRETAVAISLLKRLDAEILIGQLSYQQRAEIYNLLHYSTLPQAAAARLVVTIVWSSMWYYVCCIQSDSIWECVLDYTAALRDVWFLTSTRHCYMCNRCLCERGCTCVLPVQQ